VRKSALVAGLLYLVTFIAGIPPSFLYEPILTNGRYILGAGAEAMVGLAAVLDVITGLAGIGTAVALYSVVRRHHEGMALGFVTTRIIECALIAVGALGLITVSGLRQVGSAADAGTFTAIQQALVTTYNWAHAFGPGLMPVFNALLIGTLMYQTRLIPRPIATLGLIGAPILLASTLGVIFGINDEMSLWTGLSTIPIFFWELSFGLWMTFKGFNPSAPVLAKLPSEMTATRRAGNDGSPLQPAHAAGGA
jgi:hypothetical protein